MVATWSNQLKAPWAAATDRIPLQNLRVKSQAFTTDHFSVTSILTCLGTLCSITTRLSILYDALY